MYVFQIGIKSVKYFQLVLIFTIGIKITYMFTSLNWYQNFLVGFFKMFMYFQLVCFMYFQLISWCTKLIYIFNWYHNVSFWFHHLLIFVSNKKGENIILLFTLNPLLMIERRRSIWVYMHVYMHDYLCKFISKFVSYWY